MILLIVAPRGGSGWIGLTRIGGLGVDSANNLKPENTNKLITNHENNK